MKKEKLHEDCWHCDKTFIKGDLVVTVYIQQMYTETQFKHVPGQLYNLYCLECACKQQIAGFTFEQLSVCAPEGWENQLSPRTLMKMYFLECDYQWVLSEVEKLRNS